MITSSEETVATSVEQRHGDNASRVRDPLLNRIFRRLKSIFFAFLMDIFELRSNYVYAEVRYSVLLKKIPTMATSQDSRSRATKIFTVF